MRSHSQAAGTDRGASYKGSRVFVAEDDADTRDTLSQALAEIGFDVRSAASADELFDCFGSPEMFDRWRAPPDVIVSDVRLPGFDGVTVLEGIRWSGWLTPFILMTAFGDRDLRHRAERVGATAFFEKPLDLSRFEQAVIDAAEGERKKTLVERRAPTAVESRSPILAAAHTLSDEESGELAVLRLGQTGWIATGVLTADVVNDYLVRRAIGTVGTQRVSDLQVSWRQRTGPVSRRLTRLERGEVDEIVAVLRRSDAPRQLVRIRGVERF